MPKGVPGSKAPHGTVARYVGHGCRCDECRTARREYQRVRLGRRSWAEHVASLPPVEHGTETRYKAYGCRCVACKKASADARRARRHANIEATRAYDRARWHGRKRAAS